MKPAYTIKLICLIFCIGLSFLIPTLVQALTGLNVNVEVIKADRNSKEIDPQLKDLVKELGPLLNFSGFSLLKKTETRLNLKQIQKVILPSNRILELQFLEFKDNQARLQVRIIQEKKETFRTILLLVDKGSVLIGGPPHKDGVLLLRIGAKFIVD